MDERGVGINLDDRGKGGRRGGSERWVPEDSDSQRGMTRKAGRLGGIEEDGEVSLLRLLSIHESESDTAWLGCWPPRRPSPERGNVPFLTSYRSPPSRGEAGCDDESERTPEPQAS